MAQESPLQVSAGYMRNTMGLPSKIENRTATWASISPLDIFPRKLNHFIKEIPHVHYNSFHISQDIE